MITIKTGDILFARSDTYDGNTNNHFYEVIEIIGKAILIVEMIGASNVHIYENKKAGTEIANPAFRTGFKSRIRWYGKSANIDGVRAVLWDKTPLYYSFYDW